MLKPDSQRQRRYFADHDEDHFHFQTTAPLMAESEAALLADVVPERPGAALLEVGCGEGANLFHLWAAGGAAERWTRLCGLDRSAHKAVFAGRRLRAAGAPVDTLAGDAARLPLRDGSFDVVLIRDLLHHLPDRVAALAEARRVLRPGGRLILIEPNRLSPLVLAQVTLIPEERGALRSSAARLEQELLTAGFVGVTVDRAQPLPLSRVALHPRLGGRLWRSGPRGHAALRRAEALLGAVLPRPLWLYLSCRAAAPARA